MAAEGKENINPYHQIFVENLKKYPLIKDEVQDILKKRKFKFPILIKQERHTNEDIQKINNYDILKSERDKWQNTFISQTPKEVVGQIENLKNDLKSWIDKFPNLTAREVRIKYDEISDLCFKLIKDKKNSNWIEKANLIINLVNVILVCCQTFKREGNN